MSEIYIDGFQFQYGILWDTQKSEFYREFFGFMIDDKGRYLKIWIIEGIWMGFILLNFWNMDMKKITDFIGKSIVLERLSFVEYAKMRDKGMFQFPPNDEFVSYIDDEGNITDSGWEFLLDEFDPDGDAENISYDQGYFCGYKCAMNDLLRYLNTKGK